MPSAVHANEQHRADLFVGRADELRRLERLMSDGGPRLAFVSGPGGAGKTELLFELGRRAKARGIRVGRVDGGLVPCSELAVMDAVRRALELGSEHPDQPMLLLVDRYETLAPLDDWVRDVLLPSLPDPTRVVFAGRDPMSTRSRTHWQGVVEHLTLGPLSPEAALEYLERRDIPAHRHADIAEAAHGHPLALVLFAELVLRDPDSATALSEHPAVVQALIERLVAGAPSPWQREALWCGAVVLHLSEELLLAMTRSDSAQRAFEWLRQLPFVAATPHGLALHDLVRELLDADLAWRFPSLRQRLIARAARYFRTRAEHPSSSSIALNLEVAYLWRDAIPYTDGTTTGLVASTMRPSDRDELHAMLRLHQGETAWDWFSRWSASGAEVLVVRGPGGRPQALALYLWLDRVDPTLARQDPGCASAMAWLAARGELEGVVYRRFHVDRDAHQALAPSTLLITAHEFEMHVRRPEMRNALRAWVDPGVGLRELPPGMLSRVPEADFDQGGLRFHVLRTNAHGVYFAWCLDRIFMPLLAVEDEPDPKSVTSDPLSSLSRRQREVAELVSLGLTNKEIATELGTSAHTVRNQLVAAFERLGVATRSELAALVARTSRDGSASAPKH